MSTEFGYIDTMDGKVHLTLFWGGQDNGVSVQLTPESGNKYICLSMEDTYKLKLALDKVFNTMIDSVEKEFCGVEQDDC